MIHVRDARVDDMVAIAATLNALLDSTTIAYRTEPYSLAEREAWFAAQVEAGLPTLVAVDDVLYIIDPYCHQLEYQVPASKPAVEPLHAEPDIQVHDISVPNRDDPSSIALLYPSICRIHEQRRQSPEPAILLHGEDPEFIEAFIESKWQPVPANIFVD